MLVCLHHLMFPSLYDMSFIYFHILVLPSLDVLSLANSHLACSYVGRFLSVHHLLSPCLNDLIFSFLEVLSFACALVCRFAGSHVHMIGWLSFACSDH